MNRRHFMQSTAAVVALTHVDHLFGLEADNVYRKEIGIQLYTLRNQIKADTAGTIKAVADAGYKQVELYGFPNADHMIKAARDNGLAINSSHFAWDSVVDPSNKKAIPFAAILEKATKHGFKHLVIPYVHTHNRKNLDDYRRLAENFNKAAVEAKKAGIQLAYHNHAFEFQPMDGGKSGFDIFIEDFCEDMKFEIDTFWVKVGNVNPAKLIRQLKGRVTQLHLKDLKKGTKLPSYGGVGKDAFKELGNGIIKWEPILKATKTAGVEICHVEQDQSPDPIASVQQSMKYLKSL